MSQHTPEKWPEPSLSEEGEWQIYDSDTGDYYGSFQELKHAKTAFACVNACRDMDDPEKEIQAMRELIEKISKRKCEILAEHGQTCRDYPNDAPDDYCPSCLARHTLGGGK